MACCFVGCQNDQIGPQSTLNNPDGIFAYNDGLIIVNEGTFNFSNASITYYQPENGQFANEIYSRANNEPLGDILQSVYLDDNDLYLVVNNSSRIVVVNPATMETRHRINNIGSPRYVRRFEDRLFVSQLFDDHIWVLNAQDGSVLDKWEASSWTERMELVDSILWVEDQVNGALLGFNLNHDTLRYNLDLPGGVSDLIMAAGHLYAFAHASVGSDLVEVDPHTGTILRSYDLGPMDASYLNYFEEEDALYFWSNTGVYKFDRASWAFQSNPVATTGSANVGGLYRDPLLGDWYYTNVLDFATRGWLYRLDPLFTPVDTVRVGFVPRILFRP